MFPPFGHRYRITISLFDIIAPMAGDVKMRRREERASGDLPPKKGSIPVVGISHAALNTAAAFLPISEGQILNLPALPLSWRSSWLAVCGRNCCPTTRRYTDRPDAPPSTGSTRPSSAWIGTALFADFRGTMAIESRSSRRQVSHTVRPSCRLGRSVKVQVG
jgi:hypothetical protein